MSKKLTSKKFIEKCILIHGNRYDYSKVEYVNNYTDVCIICPEHGKFEQLPKNHLRGKGCQLCGGTKKLTTEDFVKKAKKVHNGKYDYSKVKYLKDNEKVCIICPEHGEFEQLPYNHKTGQGCPKCYGNKKLTTECFIEKSKDVHGNKYDYSLVDYKNNRTKIPIICPEHGVFKQIAKSHIKGHGCPVCKSSSGEIEIRQFLDYYGFIYKEQHKFDDCKNIKPLKFDFYLPDLNLVIEYNGIQHYKSIEYFGGVDRLKIRKLRDQIKKEYCNTNGIELLVIKYNDNLETKLKKIL